MRRVIIGSLAGGALFCVCGVFGAVLVAYLNSLRPGIAMYQRDLWSLGAIYLAVLFAPLGACFGIFIGGAWMFLRNRNTPR